MASDDSHRCKITVVSTAETVADVETAKARKMLQAWLTAAPAASSGEGWRTFDALSDRPPRDSPAARRRAARRRGPIHGAKKNVASLIRRADLRLGESAGILSA
jgi:hypothetical protein